MSSHNYVVAGIEINDFVLCSLTNYDKMQDVWRILISVHHCAIRDPSLKVELFLDLKVRCCATVYTSHSSVPKFPRVIVRLFLITTKKKYDVY